MGIHRVVVVSLMFDHDHHTNKYIRTIYVAGFVRQGNIFNQFAQSPRWRKITVVAQHS